MPRRYLLAVLLTALTILAAVYGGVMSFHESGLPFSVTAVDAGTAVLQPLEGIPLPPGVRAGDQIDIAATPHEGRLAFLVQNQPLGKSYPIAVRRDGGILRVSVTTVDQHAAVGYPIIEWMVFFALEVTALVALLALWRGRGRAAAGLAAWCLALTGGYTLYLVPLPDGDAGLYTFLATNACFLLARMSYFFMADAIARPILSSTTRRAFLTAFLFLLGVASLGEPFGGPALMVSHGSAAGLLPRYGILWAGPYLFPLLLLLVAYRRADVAQRLKLRWMLWASAAFIGNVIFSDATPIGFVPSFVVSTTLSFAGMLGFLYTVLRHRVVDVAVVLDRTLVYGATTALVVGIVAAINSVALRAIVGEGAGLLLQIVVPLALGIVLGRVRVFLDMIVERVFFRSKYLSEKALKTFARRAGQIDDIGRLLHVAVTEIAKHTRSPGVALYEATETGYTCLDRAGDVQFPALVDRNDPAMVALRSDRKPVDLADMSSALGTEVCVFPITVLGFQRGALVCADRPGESYARDERKLVGQVVRQVGAAWRILRARENEELLRVIATGALDLDTTRNRARLLLGV